MMDSLRIGDMGYLDDDGHLVDRLKELTKYEGYSRSRHISVLLLAFLPATVERTGLETGPVASIGVCVGDGHCSDREVARGMDERLPALELEATRRVDAGGSQRIP